MRERKRPALFFAYALAWLCVAWVVLVNAVYVATLDLGTFTTADGGPTLQWFLPNLLVPVGLTLVIWQLGMAIRPLAVAGGVAGLLTGFWFNALVLTVPYLGLYPSVPVIPLALALSGDGMDAGPSFILPILAANLVLWCVVGCFGGWLATKLGLTHDGCRRLGDGRFSSR